MALINPVSGEYVKIDDILLNGDLGLKIQVKSYPSKAYKNSGETKFVISSVFFVNQPVIDLVKTTKFLQSVKAIESIKILVYNLLKASDYTQFEKDLTAEQLQQVNDFTTLNS